MATSESELCSRVESKAKRLVEQRSRAIADATGRRQSDESARSKAAGWGFSNGDAGCGLVIIPIGAAILGGILDLGGCMLNGCSGVGFYSTTNLGSLFFPIGIVLAIYFLYRTVTTNSAAERLKITVENDEEAVQLAQQRLASAKALQDRVNTLTGRMRATTDDAEREAAASQLRRLEGELDQELA